MNLKQLSYQNYPVIVQVFIHGEDITRSISAPRNIKEIKNITQRVDYPDLTEYRMGESGFIINDADGDFAANNEDNFFVRNGGQQSGYHSPVEIKSGFSVDGVDHLETIFVGEIIRIKQAAKSAQIDVVCGDRLRALTTGDITDFGIDRHFMLLAGIAQESANGAYPILRAVLPPSDDSIIVNRGFNNEINQVDELSEEGELDSRNFIVSDSGIESEGGLINNINNAYPQIEMKSPFRHIHVLDAVEKVLDKVGIDASNRDIQIVKKIVSSNFSSNGRPGYNIIGNIGSSNPISWEGHITDIIQEGDYYYFLYNAIRGDVINRSSIIRYNKITRVEDRIHRAPTTGIEYWRFAKDGDNFAILTSGAASYDAMELSCTNTIALWNQISNTYSNSYVSTTSQYKPQLAHFYVLGNNDFEGGIPNKNYSTTMLPDSRRNIVWHNSDLYYAYYNQSTQKLGIARAMAGDSVIEVDWDQRENHAGICFEITGSTLKGAVTFTSTTSSRLATFVKVLS